MKTPQIPYPELANAIGVPDVWLKREDQHHFGSHKGRSIPHMIDEYQKLGLTNFVVSSSGNAALAAMLYIQTHNMNNTAEKHIKLTVFVGEKIDTKKLKRLQLIVGAGIHVKQVVNPKQQAFQMEKSTGAKFLRQSRDDLALVGYRQLAEELNHIPNLEAIFIPTSSGTTAQGLGEAFATLEQKPQIHIIQTTSCHPIADACNFVIPSGANKLARESAVEESLSYQKGDSLADTKGIPPLAVRLGRDDKNASPTIASAIVDHVAFRKNTVVGVVKKSGGAAWIVSDDEIRAAIKVVHDTTQQIISPNSALSVAGLAQAVKHGWKLSGAAVCVITGQ